MSLRNKFVNIVETVMFGATSGVWDVVKTDRIMTMENYRELCMVVFLCTVDIFPFMSACFINHCI